MYMYACDRPGQSTFRNHNPQGMGMQSRNVSSLRHEENGEQAMGSEVK